MSRDAWTLIKNSKCFYVNTYRRAGSILIGSMVLNVFLGLGIVYIYLHRPAIDYYATYGGTAPVPLTALDSPNNTATPLLPNDPLNADVTKNIPQ